MPHYCEWCGTQLSRTQLRRRNRCCSMSCSSIRKMTIYNRRKRETRREKRQREEKMTPREAKTLLNTMLDDVSELAKFHDIIRAVAELNTQIHSHRRMHDNWGMKHEREGDMAQYKDRNRWVDK